MSGERILVVEDDASILAGLVLNLEMEGHQVVTAQNGQDALDLFERDGFDLVLLDLMLPGLNGFEVIERIRQRGHQVPVIFLSARDAQQDKVAALDLGGDDYITKPFGVAELLARVKAALRRSKAGTSAVPATLRFGQIEIDPRTRRVTRHGQPVELTTRELDLLLYLVRVPDRVVTREQILENVWGPVYEGTDRTVDNFVARLRTKLEEHPDAPRHIETVRGVGYRFKP